MEDFSKEGEVDVIEKFPSAGDREARMPVFLAPNTKKGVTGFSDPKSATQT
jgi:hypothetical protein